MQIVTAIAAFLTIWCVTLFVILPFGIETEENPEEGWIKVLRASIRFKRSCLFLGFSLLCCSVFG